MAAHNSTVVIADRRATCSDQDDLKEPSGHAALKIRRSSAYGLAANSSCLSTANLSLDLVIPTAPQGQHLLHDLGEQEQLSRIAPRTHLAHRNG